VAQILAERRGAAVVSADSMLVYRGMDIGTAKPSPSERGAVPYYGLDLADPSESYSAGAWVRAVASAFRAPAAGVPIVVGGTGLYIRALLSGLDVPAADEEARARWQGVLAAGGVPALQRALLARDPRALDRLTDPLNPRRLIRALERLDAGGGTVEAPAGPGPAPRIAPRIVGLRVPRPILHRRIRERVERMFAGGLAEEVRALRDRFPVWSDTARTAIGYAEAAAWMDGRMTRAEAIERTVIRTRQLAKRQETWFRHQAQVAWVDVTDTESAAALAGRVNEQWEEHGAANLRGL
jgi:tRNA dimethylallyltransferase